MNQRKTRLLIAISFVCSIACSTIRITNSRTLTPAPTPSPTPTAITEAMTLKPGWNTYTSTKHLTDMALDQDGYLWVTTEGGAIRWKPAETTYIRYTTTDGLADNHVTSVAVAPDGTLWFGTQGGVSHYDGRAWTNYKTQDPISDIAVSTEGIVWVGSDGSGVSSFSGKKWTTYTSKDGLADDAVQAIAVSSDGTLWAATEGSRISRFDGEHWHTMPKRLSTSNVRAMTVAPDGTLWLGTFNGVFQLNPTTNSGGDEETWAIYREKNGLVSADVHSIATSPDGSTWIGTTGGVSRFKETDTLDSDSSDQAWTNFGSAVNLAEHHITIAPDGTLWASTYVGFYHFDGETWISYPLSDGLLDDFVTTVAIGADGAVWVGTATGVSRFDPSALGGTPASGRGGQAWTSYPFDNSLSGLGVTSIAPAPDGTLWAGLDLGFAHLDSSINSAEADSRWTFYGTEEPIYALAVTPDSAVWIATSTEVFRFDGQTRTPYTVADGLPGDITTSIAAAPDGTLWYATNKDILSFDDHSWVTHPVDDILYDEYITSISVASDGAVWFMVDHGGHSGVYRIDGGVSTGIIGDAYAIAAAADGMVWARTADGVAHYDRRGGPTSEWTIYTVKDGLSSSHVNDIAVGLDGSVWVGTENGLSRYVPPQ